MDGVLLRRTLIAAAFAVALPAATHAETRTWSSPTDGLFSDPANWTPAGTPGPDDAALFPAGPSDTPLTATLDADASHARLTVHPTPRPRSVR